MLDAEQQKRAAAEAAAGIVRDGDVVGLGTGSTVAWLLPALAKRVQAGLRFVGVATSGATERLAGELGLALGQFDDYKQLDLGIDGADEVDPNLNLIKGLGGALLREKLVACAVRRLVIIVDEGKLVGRLGTHATVPIEVVPFGWTHTCTALQRLGATAEIRGGAQPFLTDGGHYVLDARFDDYSDPALLGSQVKAIAGVVEHGFFFNMADEVIVGHADGSVETLMRSDEHTG